jgi:hypothetical protein
MEQLEPEILFEDQEWRQELELLLAQLPDRYRIAITCYLFTHDLSIDTFGKT